MICYGPNEDTLNRVCDGNTILLNDYENYGVDTDDADIMELDAEFEMQKAERIRDEQRRKVNTEKN